MWSFSPARRVETSAPGFCLDHDSPAREEGVGHLPDVLVLGGHRRYQGSVRKSEGNESGNAYQEHTAIVLILGPLLIQSSLP
jgi:hypothetical protein